MTKIKISCHTKDHLNYSELTEFQGELKHREDEDVRKIINSIKKYGFTFPFFVWKNKDINYVIDGHGRLEALKTIDNYGFEIPPLPVVYVDCKDEKSAKDLLLRLNSQYGKMTKESVLDFIGDLDLNLEDFSLPCDIIDFDFGDDFENDLTVGDDEAPELNADEPADSQYGECYQLGDSVLMCGDATNEDDMNKLMMGDMADLIFTDPPYGIDYSGGRTQVVRKKDYGKFENDDLKGEELGNLICNVFKYNKGEADVYICVSPIMQKPFLDFIALQNKIIDAVIVWDKKQPGLGYMAYRRQCEFILFIKGKAFRKGDKSDIDLWRIGKDDAQTYVHEAQKPVELSSRAIINSSKADDIVLDMFGGSGSTLIACEKLHRKARVMEIDPHYCDVIRKRYTKWAKENGKNITSGCLD